MIEVELKRLRCAGTAVLLLLMLADLLAVDAAAKEPPNYGRLTMQITGLGGTQRTFFAESPEEQQRLEPPGSSAGSARP